MPQAVAAVAAWAAKAALVITGSANVAAFVGNTVLFLGSLKGIATIAALASYAKSRNRPQLNDGNGQTLQFRAAANPPSQLIVGRAATGGLNAFATTIDSNQQLNHIVALSVGPVQGLHEFRLDAAPVGVFPDGNIGHAKYGGWMGMVFRNGASAESAFELPGEPQWTADHKLSSIAHCRWSMNYSADVYTTGVPAPLWVIDGAMAYDPRQDSTYPGGSGDHRHYDRETWEWTRNGALIALSYALGYFVETDNGPVRVAGLGAPIAFIDVPSFVDAANLAALNEWTCDGVLSDDDKLGNMQRLCAAFGSEFTTRAGKLGVTLPAAQDSVVTLTDDDLAGAVVFTNTQSRRERYNQALPYYAEPNRNYEMAPAALISNEDYIAEDGGAVRTLEVRLPYVTNPTQAGQLAALALAETREHARISALYKPKARIAKEGQCVDIDHAEIGVTGKFKVIRRALQPGGEVHLDLITCNDAKFPWALGQSDTAPAGFDFGRYDPADVAEPEGWEAETWTEESSQGKSPAIRVTGLVTDPLVNLVVFEYRPAADPENDDGWRQWLVAGRSVTEAHLVGLAPERDYDIAVRYRRGTATGPRQKIFAVTSGISQATSSVWVGDVLAQTLVDQFVSLQSLALRGIGLDDRRNAYLGSLGYLNGVDGLTLGETVLNIETISDGLVETVDLIGVKSGDGLSFILDGSTVKLSPTESLAERFTDISASLGSAASSIITLQSASATQASAITTLQSTVGGHTSSISTLAAAIDGVEALYSIALNVNGHATGFYVQATGTTTDAVWLVNKFIIVDPGNGLSTPFIPFSVSGGNVKMHNVEVNKINVNPGGSGARTVITNERYEVYDSSNVLRVKLGVW